MEVRTYGIRGQSASRSLRSSQHETDVIRSPAPEPPTLDPIYPTLRLKRSIALMSSSSISS